MPKFVVESNFFAHENPPTTDLAIIIGCGKCAEEDFKQFKKEFRGVPYTIWAVNDIACYIKERVEHVVCIDSWMFEVIKLCRLNRNLNTNYFTHSLQDGDGGIKWKFSKRIARNSGMMAIAAALNSGHTKVILIGIPMDSSGHFYGIEENDNTFYHENLFTNTPWITPLSCYDDKIRSMSGLTKDRWGYPGVTWSNTK